MCVSIIVYTCIQYIGQKYRITYGNSDRYFNERKHKYYQITVILRFNIVKIIIILNKNNFLNLLLIFDSSIFASTSNYS